MASRVDVVIVGAGAAGLSAAKSARSRGLSFVLLEASNRIGGRAWTEDFGPGQPFGLGCHWMHSASLNPFVGIADRLGFRYSHERGWDGPIHHLSRRIHDRAARRGRDRGRAEWAGHGRVTANHAMPTTRGRRTDHVRSTTEAASVAIRGLFTSADRCGRAPAGTLAAKQIFLAEVRPNLYTDIRDT